RCASLSASANDMRSSAMRVRMKLVVPLTIPITRRIRSPASDSRSGRIRGIPPATDASKSRSTPAVSAASNSSLPTLASSSLFAVTTGLPRLIASVMTERAGSIPPITSTTTSTSSSATTTSASCVKTPAGSGTSRSRARLRTATRPTSIRTPARDSIRSAWSSRRRTSADPTFPQPSRPTLMESVTAIAASLSPGLVQADDVVERLAPDDDARLAVADEDDCGAWQPVVVGRHRVAVRAGARDREHVPHLNVLGQRGVAHEEVALLAVLARDGGDERARRLGARGNERLVARPVHHGARVVAHPAVDRDVRPHVGDVLDRADAVQRQPGRPRDRAPRLDHQSRRRVEARRAARTRERVAHRGRELPDRRSGVTGVIRDPEPTADVQLADR